MFSSAAETSKRASRSSGGKVARFQLEWQEKPYELIHCRQA
jgi:hypothetical protein